MAKPEIPMRSGIEQDLLTGWRKVLCYAQQSGIVRYAKRKYNKRVRQHERQMLSREIIDNPIRRPYVWLTTDEDVKEARPCGE